jgi:integrase/recombinase XerD
MTIKTYLKHIEHIVSERTLRDYTFKLSVFDKFATDRKLNIDLLNDYVRHLKSLPLSDHTKASYLRALKTYVRWLAIEADDRKLMSYRGRITARRDIPKAISEQTFQKLLTAATSEREKLILIMLRDTGARVGSVCSLRWQNINFERKTMMIEAKGNKLQMLFISARLLEQLQQYKQTYPTLPELVFDVQPHAIQQMLRRLKKKAGVTEICNPHSFRHAFARDSITRGLDLARTSRLLGHTNIKTTATYYAIFAVDELDDVFHRIWG